MASYSVIVLIFGFIILFLLIILYFINRILQYKLKIDNSFLAIKECINNQTDIIDNITDFLEKNLIHEKSYLNKLKLTKKLLLTIKNNKEGIEIIKKIEKDVFSFVKLENTYKNLTKNKDYINIKEDIIKNRNKMEYAIDIYDKRVIEYNDYREKKIIYYLSKLCRIPEYDCYNK